ASTPNLVLWNAGTSACAKALRWRWALQLTLELSSWGLQPDMVTYNAVTGACQAPEGRRWTRILELLAAMRERDDLQPGADVLSSAAAASLSAACWLAARPLMDRLQSCCQTELCLSSANLRRATSNL
ncbi:unnamed protein product, partial [Polarella glacialis]